MSDPNENPLDLYEALTGNRLNPTDREIWQAELRRAAPGAKVADVAQAVRAAAGNWAHGCDAAKGKPALAQVASHLKRLRHEQGKPGADPERISLYCDQIQREPDLDERYNMIVRFSGDIGECKAVENCCEQRGIKFNRFKVNMADYSLTVGSDAGLEGLSPQDRTRVKQLRQNIRTFEAQAEGAKATELERLTGLIKKAQETIRSKIEAVSA